MAVAGQAMLTMQSKGGYLAKQSAADFHRLWHDGTSDRLPPRQTGVTLHRATGKWKVQITLRREVHYLGLYSEKAKADAVAAEFHARHPVVRQRRLGVIRQKHVRSYDEATLLANRSPIAGVVGFNPQPVISLVGERGRVLQRTEDHLIMTPDGWREAGELRPGDSWLILSKTVLPSEGLIPPSLRQGIGVWTSMQRASLIGDPDDCHLCGRRFARGDLTLDHEIPVVLDLLKALDVRNLRPACEPCHRMKSNAEQRLAKRNGSIAIARPETVVSSSDGDEQVPVFELIICEGSRNHLANGIVVRSWLAGAG